MAKKMTKEQQKAFDRRAVIKAVSGLIGGKDVSDVRQQKAIRAYEKKGAKGLLNQINIYRKNEGLTSLDPYGATLKNYADVRRLRPAGEEIAIEGAKQTQLAPFDELIEKAKIEEETRGFFDKETEELGRTYGRNLADTQTQYDTDVRGYNQNLSDFRTSLANLAKNRSFTERDENTSQTSDFASRNIYGSDTGRILAERLKERQGVRATQQDQPYQTSIERTNEALNLRKTAFDEAKRRAEQDQADYAAGRGRLFQEKTATELERERKKKLGITE